MSNRKEHEEDSLSEDEYAPPVGCTREERIKFYELKEQYKWMLRAGAINPYKPVLIGEQVIAATAEGIIDRKIRSYELTDRERKEDTLTADPEALQLKLGPDLIPERTMSVTTARNEHLVLPYLEISDDSASEEDFPETYILCDAADPERVPPEQVPANPYDLYEHESDKENPEAAIDISSDEENEEIEGPGASYNKLIATVADARCAKTGATKDLAHQQVKETFAALGQDIAVVAGNDLELNKVILQSISEALQPEKTEESTSPLNIAPLPFGPSPVRPGTSDDVPVHDLPAGDQTTFRFPSPDPRLGRELPPPPLKKRRDVKMEKSEPRKYAIVGDKKKRGQLNRIYFEEWQRYKEMFGRKILNLALFCDQRGIDHSVIEKQERQWKKEQKKKPATVTSAPSTAPTADPESTAAGDENADPAEDEPEVDDPDSAEPVAKKARK